MPTSFHTLRIATVPAVAATVLLVACAGSGREPIYDLRPSASPLTYVRSTEGSNEVETPAGPQGATYGSEATIVLEIGEAIDGGRSFRALVQSFSYETGGDFGSTSDDLTDVVSGQPFRGVMSPDGDLTFRDMPEFTRGVMSEQDMQGVVAELLFPLPPGGDPAAGPWPHRTTLPAGGGLEGTSVYEGTVSLAGDTVWNGIAARVMISEGIVTVQATGQPSGAPAEIQVTNAVAARTVYVWDPARGVLLAARATGSGGGDVSTMGFTMPMTVHSESLISLQP